MKYPDRSSFAALFAVMFAVAALAQPVSSVGSPSAEGSDLRDLARGHEQVFRTLSPGNTAAVLQKGDKQFTIYGVTDVRAVGSVIEITVKNGEKYSVSAGDVFFITNNAFKI